MSVSIILIPILILFFISVIAIPVLIGMYVYRDAKSRGMDALLWTLIAIFAPSFIGLIIYLIIRKEHIILSCPNCGAEVQEHFTACPNCGQKLKAACPNCGTGMNPDWKICPQCGREITNTVEFTSPVPIKTKGSKGLIALIISLVVIPILLIVFLIIGSAVFYVLGVTSDSQDMTTIIHEVMDAECPDKFNVVSVEDIKDEELSNKCRNWINEKKSEKEGIYCMTQEVEQSGAMNFADGSSNDQEMNYNLTCKYMIIVVNSPEGKACNLVSANYTTDDSGVIIDNASIMLNEVDKSKEDEFGNVFVVKFISKANIASTQKNDGDNIIEYEYQNEPIIVSISHDDGRFSYNYSIPTDKSESYNDFLKGAAK